MRREYISNIYKKIYIFHVCMGNNMIHYYFLSLLDCILPPLFIISQEVCSGWKCGCVYAVSMTGLHHSPSSPWQEMATGMPDKSQGRILALAIQAYSEFYQPPKVQILLNTTTAVPPQFVWTRREDWHCRIASKSTLSFLHTAGSGLSNPCMAEMEGNFGRSFLPFGTGDLAAALAAISCCPFRARQMACGYT